MRKPGFGQRPTGGRSGRGGSGEGRGFGGKRPGAGGGKDRFEGRRSEGRGETRGDGRGETRGEGRFGGDRKPRFQGEGSGPGKFEPRDGKRPVKRDGERTERSAGGGGFRKGPRPFRHGEDRGEYSSKPPRERDGFKKRPFRKDGDGERSGEPRGERGERRFDGKPRFERKGPPRDRFGGEGERRGGGPRRRAGSHAKTERARSAPHQRASVAVNGASRRGLSTKASGPSRRAAIVRRAETAPIAVTDLSAETGLSGEIARSEVTARIGTSARIASSGTVRRWAVSGLTVTSRPTAPSVRKTSRDGITTRAAANATQPRRDRLCSSRCGSRRPWRVRVSVRAERLSAGSKMAASALMASSEVGRL